ncbi:MAG TPA: hypothetical protein VFP68_10290, partial [Burkholderiaceae bacterium]|nr:hypothetical protein [Burkholderiaceae bacterium]
AASALREAVDTPQKALTRADGLRLVAAEAQRNARALGGPSAAQLRVLADMCLTLRRNELAHAAELEISIIDTFFDGVRPQLAVLVNKGGQRAIGVERLLFGDPFPDEDPSSSIVSNLGAQEDLRLVSVGHMIYLEVSKMVDEMIGPLPETPEGQAARLIKSKEVLAEQGYVSKYAGELVHIFVDASNLLREAPPARRSSIARSFADRVREALMAFGERFAAVVEAGDKRSVDEGSATLMLAQQNERIGWVMQQSFLVLEKLFDARHKALKEMAAPVHGAHASWEDRLSLVTQKFEAAIEECSRGKSELSKMNSPEAEYKTLRFTMDELSRRIERDHAAALGRLAAHRANGFLNGPPDAPVTPAMLNELQASITRSKEEVMRGNSHLLASRQQSFETIESGLSDEAKAARKASMEAEVRAGLRLVAQLSELETRIQAAAASASAVRNLRTAEPSSATQTPSAPQTQAPAARSEASGSRRRDRRR